MEHTLAKSAFFKNLNPNKMKKIILSLCLLLQVMKGQNNFGEFSFKHTQPVILSEGYPTQNYNGFLMAGANSNGVGFDFCIDRTSKNASFIANSWEFQNEYKVFLDPTSCIPGNNLPTVGCRAVSIIETQVPMINSEYLVAGMSSDAVFVSFLDITGTPITGNTFTFLFPTPLTIAPTKPIVKADPNLPNNYFLCYNFNNDVVVVSFDYSGVVNWSQTYQIQGKISDLELSSAGNIVMVGKTGAIGSQGGLLLHINGSNGSVLNSRIWKKSVSLDMEFKSIQLMPSGTDFIIAGSAEVSTGVFLPYFTKTNAAGGTNIYDNIIISNHDLNAQTAVDAFARTTALPWTNEANILVQGSTGLIVMKFELAATTANAIWPASGYTYFDDYLYNAPGSNLLANSISFYNTGSPYDEGMHIFGTDQNNGGSKLYLCQSYFNGHDGCSTVGFSFTEYPYLCTVSNVAASPSAGPTICNSIYITKTSIANKTNSCGPYSIVGVGNNARPDPTSLAEATVYSSQISIRPTVTNQFIEVKSESTLNFIKLRNTFGQIVFETNGLQFEENGARLDLQKLGIAKGIYFIETSSPTSTLVQKIMYTE